MNEIPQMKVAFISTFLWQVGVVLRVTKMRAVCKQSKSRHCIKKPTEKKLISERAKQKNIIRQSEIKTVHTIELKRPTTK